MPSTFNSERNRWWIAIPGAAVFLALAVGMILAGGEAPAASGYAAPTCTTSGYVQTCDGKVESVSATPKKPRAGKGFTVRFTTSSGGTYKITAKRSGATRKTLSTGVAGKGVVKVKDLGKNLKAGRYTVKVAVTSNGKTGTDTHRMTIKKAS